MKRFLYGGVVSSGFADVRNMHEQFEQDRARRILAILKNRFGPDRLQGRGCESRNHGGNVR